MQVPQEPHHVAGPTHGHGARGNRVLEDQRPAHDPGNRLTHDRVGIGVGRSGHRDHGGHLGVAQGRHRADEAGDDKGDHHRRSSFLGRLGRQHEDAGADDRTDPEHHQLKGTE